MKRHDADITAFVFGLLFILAAAAAFATQASTVALGEPTGDAWIAPALVLGAGVLAVIGTLVAASRRPTPSPAGAPAIASEPVHAHPVSSTTEMPAATVETARPDPAPVSSKYGPAGWTVDPAAPVEASEPAADTTPTVEIPSGDLPTDELPLDDFGTDSFRTDSSRTDSSRTDSSRTDKEPDPDQIEGQDDVDEGGTAPISEPGDGSR